MKKALSTKNPSNPYAISKLSADYFVKLYREQFGLFVCSIWLFSFNITRQRRSTDHRYALTVWLPTAKGVGDIEEDRVKEEKHWGDGSTLANEEKEEDVVKIW